MHSTLLYAEPPETPFRKMFEHFGVDAKKLMAAHNKWAIQFTEISPRLRPVGILYGETHEEYISVGRSLLEKGIKAVTTVSGSPPRGVSPASEKLDPLYAALAEASVLLTIHIGGELNFFCTTVWGEADAFKGFKKSAEIDLNPWRTATMFLPPLNFLTTLVVGGVFEHHPSLRFGILEFGADWIGPLAEKLDRFHAMSNALQMSEMAESVGSRTKLSMLPSEYMKRNARIAPFPFEPLDQYIERYEMEELYCFPAIFRMWKVEDRH